VEERADAKNVNNWHWSEKNATQWSKDKFTSLLQGFIIPSDNYFIEITHVSKCEGEAIANNRKAKLIFFYEWLLEIEWRGHIKGGDEINVRGKIEVDNLSEECTAEELEFTVSCDSSAQEATEVKEFVRTEGIKSIRAQLSKYINDLKHEYGKDLILPTKVSLPAHTCAPKPVCANGKSLSAAMREAETAPSSSKDNKAPSSVEKIHLVEEFACTPVDLYKVFVSEELTKIFTRGNAVVECVVGGNYKAFGANVVGNFIELKLNELIKMNWRKQSWPIDHMSTVTLEFAPCAVGTRLTLNQCNVPSADKDSTTSGWPTYYFTAIRQTFGYGGSPF